MFSFKQIEALYWIAQLGSFAAAANKLNTTQSAVNKRIRELESVIDAPMFERNRRQACRLPNPSQFKPCAPNCRPGRRL